MVNGGLTSRVRRVEAISPHANGHRCPKSPLAADRGLYFFHSFCYIRFFFFSSQTPMDRVRPSTSFLLLVFFVFSSRVVAFYHRHCRNGNRHRHCYSLSSSLLYTHRYKEPALFPSHSLFTFHEKTRQTDKDGRFSKSESFRKSQTVGADDAAKSRREERSLLRAKREEKKKKKQKVTNEREMIPAFELLVVSACCVYHFAK